MAYRIANHVRSLACDAVTANIDVGAGSGTIRIRTGAQPTNVGDADTGTLLGTLGFSEPAFGAAVNGTATANAITSDTDADASGTAGHFRIYNGAGNIHSDGTCGTAPAGDLSFNNANIVAGGTIAITSFTMTVPIHI